MTVLLVVDIGNTNISLGVFDYEAGAAGKEDLSLHWRLSTQRELTSDELTISLRSLFGQEGREVVQQKIRIRSMSHVLSDGQVGVDTPRREVSRSLEQ